MHRDKGSEHDACWPVFFSAEEFEMMQDDLRLALGKDLISLADCDPRTTLFALNECSDGALENIDPAEGAAGVDIHIQPPPCSRSGGRFNRRNNRTIFTYHVGIDFPDSE